MLAVIRSFCLRCGFAGPPSVSRPGSFAVEVVLWFFFLVPGFIYSVWRLSSNSVVSCPHCSSPGMVPAGSPNAAQMLAARGGWSAAEEKYFMQTARAAWLTGLVFLAFWWVAGVGIAASTEWRWWWLLVVCALLSWRWYARRPRPLT